MTSLHNNENVNSLPTGSGKVFSARLADQSKREARDQKV